MYSNKLHALVDAAKVLNRISPNERFITPNQRKNCLIAIQSIPLIAKDAMCFMHPMASIPHMRIEGDLVRLPYKSCWFEFNAKKNDELSGFTIGFLCWESTGCFDFSIFTTIDKNKWIFSGTFNIRLNGKDIETRGFMGNPDESTSGVITAFLAYLTALNCCNIKRTEHKPEPSKQSVRRALGRQPLFSTWTLEIDLQRTETEMPGQGGTHASPRLHLRRGHARQHKPGLWCWVQPHVVGDKSLGMIHKDYASQ